MPPNIDIWTAADTLRPEPVDVPEWDGTVHVAQLNGDERDELESLWGELREDEDHVVGFRAFVCAYCAASDDNVRLFKTPDAITAAAEKIGRRNARPVNRVFNVACRLNGLLKEDVAELEKNSAAAPSDDGSGE